MATATEFFAAIEDAISRAADACRSVSADFPDLDDWAMVRSRLGLSERPSGADVQEVIRKLTAELRGAALSIESRLMIFITAAESGYLTDDAKKQWSSLAQSVAMRQAAPRRRDGERRSNGH